MRVQKVLRRLYASGIMPEGAVRWMNSRVWTIESGHAAGLRFGFPQNPDFVAGTSERPLQDCLVRHLAAGSTFYDIGANVGFFSVLASRFVGPSGMVYAFEPVTANAAAIRRNLGLNAVSHARVFDVALADRSGSGELFVTPWDGGASLKPDVIRKSDAVQRQAVRLVTLDELVEAEGLRLPSVVKIDVEGAEMPVLKGMQRTIAACMPILVYEVDGGDRDDFERRWEALDCCVRELGYDVTHLESSYPGMRWHVGHTLAVPRDGSRKH